MKSNKSFAPKLLAAAAAKNYLYPKNSHLFTERTFQDFFILRWTCPTVEIRSGPNNRVEPRRLWIFEKKKNLNK